MAPWENPWTLLITIVPALSKFNDLHTFTNIWGKLIDICNERYGVDIYTVASGGARDTANADWGVQSVIGVEQGNCTMHVISLLLAYSIGMKENYKTEKFATAEGKEVNAKVAITLGGVFLFRDEICKKLKDLSNYFVSSPLCNK